MQRPHVTRKVGLVGLGAAGVLAAAIAVPAVASAQDPTPSPSGSSSAPANPNAPANPDQKRAERKAKLAEGLAKELGISQDKVQAALDKVQQQLETQAKADHQAALKTQLDKAVTDGKLTREQADAILKATEAGVLPGLGGGPGHGHGGPGR